MYCKQIFPTNNGSRWWQFNGFQIIMAETLPLLSKIPTRSSGIISIVMAIMSSSISKILFLKGSKSDVWVLEKYSWFNILVFTALSIASILLFTTRIVLVEATSSLLCLFALYIFYQRRVLNQLGTFRQLHNQMREKINDFMLENNKLIRTIDQMEISILGIQDVERGLQQVCKTDQVDTFVQCVKETKILNDNIKENINTRIIQDILTSILRTDRNNDLLIDPMELNRLMLRLTMMPGFDFHQDRFLQILGANGTSNSTINSPMPTTKSYSIGEIMKIFRNLLDDTIPDQENVFVLKPKQLLIKKR